MCNNEALWPGGEGGGEGGEGEEVKRKRGYRMQLGKQFGLFSAVGVL